MPASPRILVVDDEPKNAKLLAAHLTVQNYDVVTAANGEEALRIAGAGGVDVVLSDVMMPAMDGFEVTRRLRADPRTRLMPIVLITALTDVDDRIRGIEAGCDDFISKPFDKQEVLARVKTLVQINYYRSLVDEKQKLDDIIDHADNGILLLEPDGAITRMNRQAANLLAIDQDHLPADLMAHLSETFAVKCAGDAPPDLRARALDFELERLETASTRQRIIAVRTTPVRNPAGQLSSIVLICTDITEQRLEEMRKQDFLSLISHKLRTPIAVITAHASILVDQILGPISDQQREALDTIIEKSHGLAELIGKLLSFSTIYSQALDPSTEPIALSTHLPALRDRWLARQSMPSNRKMQIDLSCPEAQTTVVVNPTYLDLIFTNLWENAAKFNERDPVCIGVAVTPDAQRVRITVSDNGLGIPPEEHERILEPFYQVEKYFTGNVEGAGLGLALVKRLVTGYGGTIGVRSVLNEGTTFTFTLPAAPADSRTQHR